MPESLIGGIGAGVKAAAKGGEDQAPKEILRPKSRKPLLPPAVTCPPTYPLGHRLAPQHGSVTAAPARDSTPGSGRRRGSRLQRQGNSHDPFLTGFWREDFEL